MMLSGRQASAWLLLIVIVFGAGRTRSTSDIECLRSIKSSLRDPQQSLSSWKFSNTTSDTLNLTCSFIGVECWPESGDISQPETKVRSLRLGGMGLIGEFPRGLAYCTGLTGLDLSRNKISGSIPADISRLIGFITVLDLSHCKFSGEIPGDVANCKNLSVLKLNNNFLTGRIPASLASLRRLVSFTVANNRLVGPVPGFRSAYFPRESYLYNAELCGNPLGSCESGEEAQHNYLANGFLAGWCVSFALFLAFRWFRPASEFTVDFFNRKPMPTPTPTPTPTPKSLIQNTAISRLEKFAARMSLVELRRATGNFSERNVIAVEEMGVTYKAMLSNGWHLAIKRLSSAPQNEHQFLTEITTIGRLRHRNLVPLLGFCHESQDRFLIYWLMPNGTLHDRLFLSGGEDDEVMEWSVRARIAVGIAKGIAWLHGNGIVHRGITSKCIMLDEDFNPRISNFGKATTLNHTNSCWELPSNRVCSVLGSYEEDVHSFGKVLLELMMGKTYNEIVSSFDVDGDMLEQISSLVMERDSSWMMSDEMCCLLRVAAKCLECDPCNWPTMDQVCRMLIGEINDSNTTC